MRRLRVLHVAQSFSSGVASSIETMVEAQPDGVDAAVLGYRIPGVQLSESVGLDVPFRPLSKGLHRQYLEIGSAIAELRPDIIHLHSSWAGSLTRLLPRLRGARIVHSPHCYGFERLDLSRSARAAIRSADITLGRRTHAVLACGEHEAAVARRLKIGDDVSVFHQCLPSQLSRRIAELREIRRARPRRAGPVLVGMSGRICAQKDPEFFAEVAREVRKLEPAFDIEFRWIGGGAPCPALAREGVEVTGWLEQHQSLMALAECDIYLHTAAWEGFPMTVVEAGELGLPVIARRIDSLAADDEHLTLRDTPGELAKEITWLSEQHEIPFQPVAPWPHEQRVAALAHAYGIA